MINSGLSLLRALDILAEQTENKPLAEIVDQVRMDVETGLVALRRRMSKHPKAFSRLYIAMVRAGEVGGVLDSVLLRLADTIEKQVELRRKVKSAMTYPVVVVVHRRRHRHRDAAVHHPDVRGDLQRPRRQAAAADPDPDRRLGLRRQLWCLILFCVDVGVGRRVQALDPAPTRAASIGTRSS